MSTPVDAAELRRHALVALGLLLLCGATFALWTPRLGLLHDDWLYVHDVAQGAAPISSPEGLRPLLGLPWRLCGFLFGDALPGYYAFLFVLQWLAAVLVYLVARGHGPRGLAVALAALSMVYPGDASHLWLSTLAQRTAWLLALAAIALADRGSDGWTLPAVVLGLASLGLYELQFFLLALWPAVARLLGAPWGRRKLLAWSSIPAVYLSWRFVVRPLLGAATVANSQVLLDPMALARRALLLVPFNLFADGWLIGAGEAVKHCAVAAAVFFALAAAVALPLASRLAAGPPPGRRGFETAVVLIVFGIAPVIPTTYWLGRSAGTFGGRILAAALPGAALLLLLSIARVLPGPRGRSLAFVALLTLAFAFHWNIARLAAANWAVQRSLSGALAAQGCPWPRTSFLVILDLPPNRLAYDTPFGVGRMIREACGAATMSGIGLSGERAPGDVLSVEAGTLLIHAGAYESVPVERVVALRWQAGRLQEVATPELLSRLVPRS